MEIIGIIVEYNPFHNGHLYHINKIKEMYPDSIIVTVLNGYFMQRGELSVLTKEVKTTIALNNNIDIVLELPFVFGTQSADTFAYYSVEILNHLKVNKIIFGSEGNDIKLLKKIADIELHSPEYDQKVISFLDQGLNYPTALAKALELKEEFNSPNDLLGISYLKAISQINPQIEAITIARTNQYHDLASNEEIVSASNIRHKLLANEDVTKFIPNYSTSLLKKVNQIKIFELIKYKIISDDHLENYLTVDEGIENRLQEMIKLANNWEEFVQLIKTKRYTYNKINRMLIHILIGLTKDDKNNCHLDYLRVLGFNQIGQNYLNSIRKNLLISLKVKPDSLQEKYETRASLIYDLLLNEDTYNFERKHIPIKKD